MTIKMKNMIQNRFFIEKYAILGMKMSKNEIWKFLKAIYLNIKNVIKMFWMRFLLQGASLSIITQKSSICQKFLTPAHLQRSILIDFWKAFENWIKFRSKIRNLLKYEAALVVRNFCLIDDFWGMILYECCCVIIWNYDS